MSKISKAETHSHSQQTSETGRKKIKEKKRSPALLCDFLLGMTINDAAG